MSTRADRDVLYYAKNYKKSNKYLLKRGAPRHINGQNKGCPHLLFFRGKLWEEGSLTVEATFCATIFFLVFFSLLNLFLIIEKTERVQIHMAAAVQKYEISGTKAGSIEAYKEDSVILIWDKGEKICHTKSRYRIPFLGEQVFPIHVYQQMRYSTYDGKSMQPKEKNQSGYVYLAEHGVVYHMRADCVYLNPKIQQVSQIQLESLRNVSGRKYKYCKSCVRDGKIQEYGFITPYGDCFHYDRNCSGLKRSIRKVSREKIGNLPACSKCGE